MSDNGTANPKSSVIPLDDGSGASASKLTEALAGGFGGLATVSQMITLGRYSDPAQWRWGDRVWEHVRRDPAAGGSVDLLCYATLANDLVIAPAVTLDPGQEPDTPEAEAEVALSADVAGYVARIMDGLERPFHGVAKEQLGTALEYGADVADLVWQIPDAGEDAGQLVLKQIKPKQRRAWAMEVDAFWNLRFLLGSSGDGTGWTRWPREKFCVLTWGGRGGDPRGESIYTRAVESWNFRAQLPEDHFRFLKRFGTPKVVGKLSPRSMTAGNQAGTLAGAAVPGTLVNGVLTAAKTGMANFLNRILEWVHGSALAVGVEDSIEVHEVQSEGQAFVAAMDLYRREIVLAILLQARATMEAKSGSKADSETSQDVLGNLLMFLKRFVCRAYEWDVFTRIVAYRYGPDVARKHTPRASLGEVEHQDVAALLTALGGVGYEVDPDQYPSIDKHVGIYRVRTAEDVAKREAAKAEAAALAAAKTAPAGNEPAGDGQQQSEDRAAAA